MSIAGIIFFIAWLTVGCTVEESVESPGNMAITLLTVLVAVACVWAMGRSADGSDH